MTNIVIKDLKEDSTLAAAAMSELHGGKAAHCPKGAPSSYLPRSGQQRGEYKSFDLELMRANLSGQIDDLLPGGGPQCSPPNVIR